MKILLVYETIPESTKIYNVEVTADEWAWMKLTHGNYVNACDSDASEDACNKLTDWLEGKEPISNDAEDEAPAPILIRAAGYDYLLVTGFYL